MKRIPSLYLAYCLFLLASCQKSIEVDTIIRNAKVYTIDGSFTIAEAIAIAGDSIVEVGAEHQIMNKYASGRTIDAAGRAVFPGLIDAHGHFVGYGKGLDQLDVVGTSSFDEVISKLVDYGTTRTGDWLEGRGWDQNDWEHKSFPTNDTLNKIFSDRAVVLKRVDGHAMLVNNYVLELAGITGETKVDGGNILLREDGTPTGVLIDAAMDLVENIIPEPSSEDLMRAMLRAQDTCLQYGITTLTEPGLKLRDIDVIQAGHESHDLKMRINAMLSIDPEIESYMRNGTLDEDRLNVRAVKVYCDGALGSRGAYLKAPYADDSTHTGLSIVGRDSLMGWAKLCYETGYQMNVHCIGDQGNAMTLEVMSQVLKGTNDLRWRIEHAQVVDPTDLHFFRDFNIIPSVQPTHAISDMPWAGDRLGPERSAHAYAYADLLTQNGMIALGTDFPVESPDPSMTFFTAVERKTRDGNPEGGFQPSQKLTREQALRGMTIWAAMASFEEDRLGSLEVGKKADLVILDRDWMECDPKLIPDTRVILTMINGEIVYENP